MTTDKTPATLDAVRNLIVCDTQFTWAGVTNLTMPQMMDLQARGWVVEGDSNDEFQLTEAGEAVVARALEHGAPATLATVKHGGCVQLGDGLTIEKRAREMLAAQFDTNGPCAKTAMTAQDTYTMGAVRALIDALSSQPSPGGQGDLDRLIDNLIKCRDGADKERENSSSERDEGIFIGLGSALLLAEKALAARQPVGEIVGWQHCGENHEHMVISDRTKQALKEGESERGIQKIEAAYSIPLVRQPVCATVKDSLTVGGGQPVGEPVAVSYGPISLPPVPHGQVMPPDDRTGLYPVAHDDEAMQDYAREAVEADREQLAAGVAHVKGAVLIDGAVHLIQKGEEMDWVRGHVDGRKANFLYAAPPAQAVDLGTVRAQVAELLRSEFDLEVADPEDHRHDDGSGEADRIAGKIAALIDSQDSRNG